MAEETMYSMLIIPQEKGVLINLGISDHKICSAKEFGSKVKTMRKF